MTRVDVAEKEIEALKERVAALERMQEKPKRKSTVQTQVGEV